MHSRRFQAPGYPPLQRTNGMFHNQQKLAAKAEGDCCSICLGEYKDPRILPCQHVFCLQCLCDYVTEKKRINCPNCMTEVEIPSKGVADLLKYVKEPLQETTELEVCNVCEKGIQGSFQCFECDKYMCDACKKFHDVFSSKHRVHELEASNSEKSFCENHPKVELQFYCKTCKCLICEQCKKYSHNYKHIVLGIKDYFTEIKKQFENYLKTINAKLQTNSEVTDSFISKETTSVHEFMEHVPKLQSDLKACKEIARHREKINLDEEKILSRRLTAAVKHLDNPLNKSDNIRELFDLSLYAESKIETNQMYLVHTDIDINIEDEMGTLDMAIGRLFSFPISYNKYFTSKVFFVGGIHWTLSASCPNISDKLEMNFNLQSFVKKEDKQLVHSVTTDLVFTLIVDKENSLVTKKSTTFSPISPNNYSSKPISPDAVQTNKYSSKPISPAKVSSHAINLTQETSERLRGNIVYWNHRKEDNTKHCVESKSLQILFDIKEIKLI